MDVHNPELRLMHEPLRPVLDNLTRNEQGACADQTRPISSMQCHSVLPTKVGTVLIPSASLHSMCDNRQVTACLVPNLRCSLPILLGFLLLEGICPCVRSCSAGLCQDQGSVGLGAASAHAGDLQGDFR